MDLAGLDASPAKIGALMNALAEYDVEADTWGGTYDADGQAAADWIDGMSDSEFSEMLAEYEADSHLPGPELAGAGSDSTYDLANQMDAIDLPLAGQTDREYQRQAEDQPERGRRRASTEVRLSNALDRVGRGTYLYRESPTADLANTWGDLDAGGRRTRTAAQRRAAGCRSRGRAPGGDRRGLRLDGRWSWGGSPGRKRHR
jgi:hypothetical protein